MLERRKRCPERRSFTIDPVVMAAQAVVNYQTIVSRNLNPQPAAVLSVGAIEAGRDNNGIPETAVLKLNLRWFDEAVRDTIDPPHRRDQPRRRDRRRRRRKADADASHEGQCGPAGQRRSARRAREPVRRR
jgi:acetylornithine deacetylase/succinyl-diaminopimelate desuccinylase-like protein